MALGSSGTILFRINWITGLEIVRGDQNCTQTHTHTHRHTHTQTYTHIHTHTHTEAYFISLVFLRKCRNKTKNCGMKFVEGKTGGTRENIDYQTP